ncbi:MAG TPA: hypothetical protein PKC89_11450 [Pyrinomonadaceae bacterium]|nr:hypothetical protein [Pyrinomonadaceae bacterium]
MSVDNGQYIYDHLPARFRRADTELFLKRMLLVPGGMLDGWDTAYDEFHGSIDATTASETWVRFWLYVLFGWSWFPWWFTLVEMRRLYSHFGRHLGRKGTARGIEAWLGDFGIVARVHTRSQPWDEFVWGENTFAISAPLHIVVEILEIVAGRFDMCFVGSENVWGEGFYVSPRPLYSTREILELIRYVQPHSQEIYVVWSLGDQN